MAHAGCQCKRESGRPSKFSAIEKMMLFLAVDEN
jgi:hypothetical protein